MSKVPVRFDLNGREVGVFVHGGENLLETLRRGAGDLSPKYGCGQGTCGTCTVLIDGEPVLSCLTLAETVEGRRIDTVSGMADGATLHPLQAAFMEGFAAQCGYCTGGMMLAAKALLAREPNPSRAQVEEAISGNICRCTGYEPIVDAIMAAAARIEGRGAA